MSISDSLVNEPNFKISFAFHYRAPHFTIFVQKFKNMLKENEHWKDCLETSPVRALIGDRRLAGNDDCLGIWAFYGCVDVSNEHIAGVGCTLFWGIMYFGGWNLEGV
jgi:hypothetical protein